jgi:ATP-dependent RNA helicase MSS116, mitochondrial
MKSRVVLDQPLLFRLAQHAPLRAGSIRTISQSSPIHQNAAAQRAPSDEESEIPIANTFEDLRTHGLVNPVLVDTLTRDMKLDTMTEVQSKTIRESLSGADM